MIAALREHGLVERTLVSSNWMRSLVEIRALEPRLRLGWSVPRLRRDPTTSLVTKLPAYAGAAYLRAKLPSAVKVHMAAGRCDALMAHWRLVSPRLVRAVKRGRRRALRVDGRRRRRASAGSRRWASPGSSPTTRGSSLAADRGSERAGCAAE